MSLKIRPSILFCWPMTSKADVSDEFWPFHHFFFSLCLSLSLLKEQLIGNLTKYCLEVHTKQCNFFHMASISRDQMVNVSIVRQWVMHFCIFLTMIVSLLLKKWVANFYKCSILALVHCCPSACGGYCNPSIWSFWNEK